jgi:osmotically-inducible protein OsmY
MKKTALFLYAFVLFSAFAEGAIYDYSVDVTDFVGKTHHLGDIHIDINEQGALETASTEAEAQFANNIRTQIKQSYFDYKINIHFLDGVLTLQGFVRTIGDKSNIEKDMLKVEGVKKVENKLQIKPE